MASYPFDNLATLGWTPLQAMPGAVNRPVSGAELVLDQVRRLNDGMNDLLAEIIRDSNPDEMGSWVYKSVDLEGAKEWRKTTLHFQTLITGRLTGEFIDEFIQEKLTVPLPFDGKGGLLFHCYVLLEEQSNRAALLIHAAHTILDGPAMMDCFHILLESIVQPEKSEHSADLEWGLESANLPPHPVEVFGGIIDGWETEGLELLKELDRVFVDGAASHTIRPKRQRAENPGQTMKVSHQFSKHETSKIIACIKSMQSTVTVMLEAAHVLATLSLQPPSSVGGRTVLFPSIVALRHHMKSPWNRRETLVVTGAAVPIVASHSLIQAQTPSRTEREKMTLLMQDFRAQYAKWMSSPHHIFIVPAQSVMNPIRNAIETSDAEITNLGVVERKMDVVWGGKEAGEKLVVDEFHLGLRRPAPVLMTHAWTFAGRLRVQCQGNDIWGIDFMQRFLDEIVRLTNKLKLDFGGTPLDGVPNGGILPKTGDVWLEH